MIRQLLLRRRCPTGVCPGSTQRVHSAPADPAVRQRSSHGWSATAAQVIHAEEELGFGGPCGAAGVPAAMYNLASRLNHSCRPTAAYTWHRDTCTIVVRTLVPLAVGDEVRHAEPDPKPNPNPNLNLNYNPDPLPQPPPCLFCSARLSGQNWIPTATQSSGETPILS